MPRPDPNRLPKTLDILGHRVPVAAVGRTLCVALTQALTHDCGHAPVNSTDTDRKRRHRAEVRAVTTRVARRWGLTQVEVTATTRGAQPWNVDVFEVEPDPEQTAAVHP